MAIVKQAIRFGPPTLNGRNLIVVVAAGSVITSIGLGVRGTFGLFLDPVIDDLSTGRGMFSLAIAIQNIVWGLSQPFFGAVADRFGAGRVLASGALGYAGALLLMSTAQSPALFTLSMGLVLGVAAGAVSFSVVLAAVGRMVPPERASMALGIVTAMGSVGQFVLIPIARQLIDNHGWRTTATTFAAVVVAIALFAHAIRGTAIEQQGSQAERVDAKGAATPLREELRRAFHHRPYRLLNAAFFVCGFHVTFIATHLVSYARTVDIDGGVASTALALIGLFNVAGSLIAGYLGSRVPKTYLLSVIYAGRALIIAGFMLLPISDASVVIFGAAMGVVWLSTVPLTGGIVASQFGTTHSGTLFGIVFLSHQMGAFVGVVAGGVLADRTGSYSLVWWIAVALAVAAALLHLLIDERPAPPAPEPVVGVRRLAPAGAAVVIVLGTSAGLLAAPLAGEADEPPITYCIG